MLTNQRLVFFEINQSETSIYLADAVVEAGVRVAVSTIVTSLAAQPRRTLAVVVILQVDTLGSVQTWFRGAGIKIILTPAISTNQRRVYLKSTNQGQVLIKISQSEASIYLDPENRAGQLQTKPVLVASSSRHDPPFIHGWSPHAPGCFRASHLNSMFVNLFSLAT